MGSRMKYCPLIQLDWIKIYYWFYVLILDSGEYFVI